MRVCSFLVCATCYGNTSAPRRQLELISPASFIRAGDDNQIGRTRQRTRLNEQRIFSRCIFPRFGVAKRDTLNALAGQKHDLRYRAADANDATNLDIAVNHFTNTSVLRGRARCFAGECCACSEQHGDRCNMVSCIHCVTFRSAR
jgi:hypothetical protein